MILFHGSNQEIIKIDLGKTHKYKDFGKGFYLTTIEDQAVRMAKRTVVRNGGVPTVTAYEFEQSSAKDLSWKVFETVNNDWSLFVINNRNHDFMDFKNELSNFDNKYDIVYGAVANDDIATTFALYRDGIITAGTLTERLKFKKLNNQYSFHTQRATALLKKVGVKTYD